MNHIYFNQNPLDMSFLSDDYKLTKELISKYPNALIDSAKFPLIEKGLEGDIETLANLTHYTENGIEGFARHFGLTMYFGKVIHEINKTTHNDPAIILDDYVNFTTICAEFEQWKEAREWQLKAIKFMVANFEPEEWEYQNFDNMAACINNMNS